MNRSLASIIVMLMFCFTLFLSVHSYKMQDDYQRQALIIIKQSQDYTDRQVAQLKVNSFDVIASLSLSTRRLATIECYKQGECKKPKDMEKPQ
ncbi:hypothetical protein [Pseudomonas putida]|uniref:hypothetical protein n=1 Tax=Pseudomonas putida TaxID=303 RepID=UPI000648DCAC|nr:hypothetical protein [Pseudomonas putida]